VKISEKDGAVSFLVRVQPRASKDEIAGIWQDGLKVRLMAPPVNGRANESLRKLLAARLKVSLAAVRVVSGEHSRTKRVEMRGVSPREIQALVD
jgi:uncharacterized protein (TIGR00251 family)